MATALLLFSEGLDSLLSGLILKRENIRVIAVRFITPYFGWKYKNRADLFEEKAKTLGFDHAIVKEITEEYLKVLQNPKYGYGDHANPCIDCKIFLFKKAKELLISLNADFIATGEILGQRPMSQNKQALEVIEKESGLEGLVLRPLTAKLLKETVPEKRGLIKRDRLYGHQGRSRNFQLNLAKEFGLREIPTPAGGCLLTDPIIGSRVLKVIKEKRPLTPLTAELLTFGRHHFEDNLWIVMGRNEEENLRLKNLLLPHYELYTLNEPAPYLAVMEGKVSEELMKNILLKYSKKAQLALSQRREIRVVKIAT
ncbi:MAG: hypothetical protein N2327_06265 [Caldimicrobium sp.]|nr:hypothetical protein [Caldimicrobium sp.]MCX7874016.1 hypothetical protein [Caldimicrobium sp.]MDW8094164.1 hypothetical protein [Caldimicrobium sp.]